MDKIKSRHLLQTMIDFFEAGNQKTDAVAKAILESDFNFGAQWEAEIKRFRAGTDWTGLRSPEAEIVASALRSIQQMLDALPW